METHPDGIEACCAHGAAPVRLENNAGCELRVAAVGRVRLGLAAVVVDTASVRGLARVQPIERSVSDRSDLADYKQPVLHGEQAVDVGFANDEVEEDPYLGVRHGQKLNNVMLVVLRQLRGWEREKIHTVTRSAICTALLEGMRLQ